MKGEWVTANRKSHLFDFIISGIKFLCQNIDRDNSGSSIKKIKSLCGSKKIIEKSETICFSPQLNTLRSMSLLLLSLICRSSNFKSTSL